MILLPRGIRLDRKRDVVGDPRAFPSLYHPKQTHIWRRASFTVPAEAPEQLVQDAGHLYRQRFGEALEKQGFTILGFDGPHVDEGMVMGALTDPDRRRYKLWAKVCRRPVTVTVDVPDKDVPLYLQCGYKLKETEKVWTGHSSVPSA